MYCGTLKAETTTALLDVLIVANKFEVLSGIHHCINVLSPRPVTVETAILFLGLPSNVRTVHAVQPLINAAKGFLTQNFSKIQEFQGDIPLAILQEFLSSDELQVRSEDVLYDFVMDWSRKQYPDDVERREVLKNKLVYLIRFPYLNKEKLKQIFFTKDFDSVSALNLIFEALVFKGEPLHKIKTYNSEGIHHEMFSERAYINKHIRVVEINTPRKECMIFWDIKKDECLKLKDSDSLNSQVICFGGQLFLLKAYTLKNEEDLPTSFGLCLQMASKDEISIEYIFSARLKPSCNFVSRTRATERLHYKKMVGDPNLLSMDWSEFISDNNSYFVDDVLHLRVLLIVRT